MTSVLTVEAGHIAGPRGKVLTGIDFDIAEGKVTVILGPSGSGKSGMMRALSGEPAAPGWRIEGTWKLGETKLRHEAGQHLSPTVRWLPQDRHRRPHNGESFSRPPACETWQEALGDSAELVLLDEPERGDADTNVVDSLIAAIRNRRPGQTVVLITHHQRFAKAVADFAIFVCGGNASKAVDAESFFSSPPADRVPTDLVQQFVKTGNCWPAGDESIDLPTHFRWIVPSRLAGMGRPGLTRDADEDLASIAAAGITHLVSLTEDPLDRRVLGAHGIQMRHFAIRDMGVPRIGEAATLCSWMTKQIDDGKGIALHCHAGLGRTGTMLGALLTWWGRDPDAALVEIRKARANYVQTRSQETFIASFATRYGTSAARFPPEELLAMAEASVPATAT